VLNMRMFAPPDSRFPSATTLTRNRAAALLEAAT
jgi:hypothetical protein